MKPAARLFALAMLSATAAFAVVREMRDDAFVIETTPSTPGAEPRKT